MSSPAASSSSTLYLGATWFPELWSEEQWDKDIAQMTQLGINCVRIFEYAWARFEPSEWQFDTGWAIRVLDKLRDAQIAAILCTPTAAPPAWMISRYPEILRIGPDGKRAALGHKRSVSMVSSRYREFCSRVVDQMIHAFRGHEAVAGWLIDSNIGGADFGAESRRAFHQWLSERLGTIESLNRNWGTGYGSQAFEYFDQIPLPGAILGKENVVADRRPHPSLALAFQRFANDQWSMFIHPQAEQIKGAFEQKPVSCVMMASDWSMNWFRLNHLVDRVTVGLAGVDQSPQQALMHLDRARGEKASTPFWLMDLSPNWQGDGAVQRIYPAQDVKALLWLAALYGAEAAMFKNWRAHPAGQEMLDGALLTSTGKPAPNFDTITATTQQIREQQQWLSEHPPVEARVGVVVSNESHWYFSIDPMEKDFDYKTAWRSEFYLPLVQAHWWRDVIDQTQDFCPYHVIVLPMIPLLHQQTLTRLREWVEQGGCLLIGPMTALRNADGAAHTDADLGGLEALIGANSAGRFPTNAPLVVKWEPQGEASPEGTEAPSPEGEGSENSALGTEGSEEDKDKAGRIEDAPEPAPPTPGSERSDDPGATPDSGLGQNSSPSTPDSSAAIPDSVGHGWCEAYEPTSAKALARYRGSWADGKAAVLINRVGEGTVMTIGCRVDAATYLDLVGALCDIAQVKPLAEGSDEVLVVPRMNADGTMAGYGLINLSDRPQVIRLAQAGTDRLSGEPRGPELSLAPHEVVLLEVSAE